jgi:hypothetical protein
MDQGLRESRHLTGLADCVSMEKLCKYVRAEAKTTIALQSCQHLIMLVYYLRHQECTSRAIPNLTDVLIADIEALDHHRMVEEDWVKTHQDPEPTPVTLDTASAAKAFNQMRQILTNMQGVSKVPLAYVVRKRILPPDTGDPKPLCFT